MYKVVRYRFGGRKYTMHRGLTLDEAQEHCKRPDTRGVDKQGRRWFDGYTAE